MCLFLFDFFDVCCTFYFSISLLSCPHLCAVVNAHGKVGSFQLSKRERQQKQQTTVFNTTNNTTNNSKPTATTIVTAQRKDKSILILEGSGRAWRLSPAQSRKPKVNKSRHQKLQKLEKRTKTTEKYPHSGASVRCCRHIWEVITQSGPKKKPQSLWVTQIHIQQPGYPSCRRDKTWLIKPY